MTTLPTARPEGVDLTDAERRLAEAVPLLVRDGDGGCPYDRYQSAIEPARRAITHRLVAGLIRENVGGFADDVRTVRLSDPVASLETPTDVAGSPSVDRIRPIPAAASTLLVLPLPAIDTSLAVFITGMGAYRRPKPVGDVYRCDGKAVRPVARPSVVLELAWAAGRLDGASRIDVDRVSSELADSAANLALASVRRDRRTAAVCGRADDAGWDTDVDYLLAAPDPLVRSERLVVDGHPLHPGAKLRQGFRPSEVVAYAAEYDAVPALRFVAIADEYAATAAVADGPTFTERLYRLVPGLRDAVADETTTAGRDPADVTVLPVHPWQYRHQLTNRYGRELDRGIVIPVPDVSLPAGATLSLRTLVPKLSDRQAPPHVKVSLGIRTTSSVRTITPQTTLNGPTVSDVLETVLGADEFRTLSGLPETAGACFHDPDGPHTDGRGHVRAKHLAALLRRNPLDSVDDGELPMTAAALLARGPLTDRPLIDSLVPEGGADAAAAFLRRYAEAIVPDALRLLVAYGVGLEAHLQNCVVVFDEWKPKRVLVRDYGGLRLCTDRLAEHGYEFEPYPGSVTVDDGMEPAYDKLTYALFQNHLAELVRVLVRYRPIDESRCWALLSEVVADAFAELRRDGVPNEWVADAETVLYDATWNYKCLTTMRLTDRSHHYALESVPNPLSRPER